jgi:hypothetical protein
MVLRNIHYTEQYAEYVYYDLDLHVLLLDPLLGLGGLQLVGQLSLCFLNKNTKLSLYHIIREIVSQLDIQIVLHNFHFHMIAISVNFLYFEKFPSD